MRLFFILIIFSIFSKLSFASCGVPQLIDESEQIELRSRVIVKIEDYQFQGQRGLNIVSIEIPEVYRDKLLEKAYVTYWKSDEIISHSSLVLTKGYSYTELRPKNIRTELTGSKKLSVSTNTLLGVTPKITLVFGANCYNRFQLNIDNLEDFKLIREVESERHNKKQNTIFMQGR